MSVIIRLQNLPWSASALDIRTFFSGLSIPEGGVHIVGGELGDAFIAFSTDEDARLAIQRDNGRLKDTMVKLLLSSRSEMHKVIETARQRVSVMQVPAAAPVVAPAALPSHLVQSTAGQTMNMPSPNSAPATVVQTSPAYAPPFSSHSYGASPFVTSTFATPNLAPPNLGTNNLNALNIGTNNTSAPNFSSSSFSASNLGSNNAGSSNFSASNLGASNLIAPNLNLSNFNSPHLGVPNHGSPNFGGPNLNAPNFNNPNFGASNHNFSASNHGTSNFSGPNLGTSNFSTLNHEELSLPSFGSAAIHSLGLAQQVAKEPPPQPAVIEPPVVAGAPNEQQNSKRSAESRSRYGRSRSKSRDKEKKSRSRRDRSRSKDRSHRRRDRTRSRDRDRRDRRRDRRSRSKDRSRERDSRKSREAKNEEVATEQPVETPVVTRSEGLSRWSANTFKDISVDPLATPMIAFTQPSTQLNPLPSQPPTKIPALMTEQSPPEGDDKFNSMDNTFSRLQELGSRRNPNAFQDSNDLETRNNFQSDFRGKYEDRRNRNDHRDKREFSRNFDTHGACIKISGLAPQTGYGEVRRFFSGYYIPNNGLKMINDDFGKRSGVVYIKFARPENKITALKYDGRSLSGQRVSIEHLDDDEYECAIDNKRPLRSRSFHADPSQDMSHDGDKQYDNYEEPNEEDCEQELQNYNILFLDDMPPVSKEYDVVKMFSDYSLVSISMFPSKQYKKMLSAFVHFVNADDAKLALLNRMKHMIGRKVVPVTPCKQEAFEIAKKDNIIANEESNSKMESNSNIESNSNMETNSIEETNSNEENDANEDVPISAPVSRDPRQRQMAEAKKPDSGNGPSFLFQPNISMPLSGSNHGMPPSLMPGQRMPWHPDMPLNRPPLLNMPNMPMHNNGFNKPFEDTSSFDCVHLKSLPPDTSDRNILDFFSEVGVIPTRIHIMLNSSGEQSGDCFCEFSSVHDARKAVSKNGAILGPHTIEIELCSERRVQDALQRPLHGNNMFSGPGRREHFNGPPRGMRGGFGGRGMGPMGRGGFMPRGRGMPPGMRPMRGNFRGGLGPGPSGHGGHRFPPSQHFNKFGNNHDTTLGDPEIENFGAPGCYVSLENVPFKAGVDEILEFFSNYDLTASDVIRRFNEKGMPTGDARVNFRTPEDAREAVEKLNFKMIRDRRISLQLLN